MMNTSVWSSEAEWFLTIQGLVQPIMTTRMLGCRRVDGVHQDIHVG